MQGNCLPYTFRGISYCMPVLRLASCLKKTKTYLYIVRLSIAYPMPVCDVVYLQNRQSRFRNILCTIIIFSNPLWFASLFAHLSSILNNFNCNDENWIFGK